MGQTEVHEGDYTKFILISIKNDGNSYTFLDDFIYDSFDQHAEDQLYRIFKISDKKRYLTINSNGLWLKCGRNETNNDFLYSIEKIDKFIFNHSKELSYGKRDHFNKLPDIFDFILTKIQNIYYYKNISIYNDNPLFNDFYGHLLNIVELFNNEKELSKYIEAFLKVKQNFISKDMYYFGYSYLYIPYIFIIHVINNNNKLINRYIEVTRELNTALCKKLAPCLNIISDEFDCRNYNVADIDNAIFQDSDEKVKSIIGNKHFIEIPIKHYKNFSVYFSKQTSPIRKKYYEDDTKPHGGSFHKDFILKKQNEEISNFWRNDDELRLIYLIITKGLLGYPEKKVTELIKDYYNDSEKENSAFYKSMDRISIKIKYLEELKKAEYRFLDISYIHRFLME